MHKNFDLTALHPSWLPLIQHALRDLDCDYIQQLLNSNDWLPGADKLFNAFSLPFSQTRVILLGESPYPRPVSANGYAFWDGAVSSLWSESGLSKAVNRATSLRNFIKMLLLARGDLKADNMTQDAIAHLDKSNMIQTAQALFENMMAHGILLLNATLVLRTGKVREDAIAWQAFLSTLLNEISKQNNKIVLLLLGKIAQRIESMAAAETYRKIISEHPYNISFITNDKIIQFFKPLDLLNPLSTSKKSFTIAAENPSYEPL